MNILPIYFMLLFLFAHRLTILENTLHIEAVTYMLFLFLFQLIYSMTRFAIYDSVKNQTSEPGKPVDWWEFQLISLMLGKWLTV